jgi:hypothetical protein
MISRQRLDRRHRLVRGQNGVAPCEAHLVIDQARQAVMIRSQSLLWRTQSVHRQKPALHSADPTLTIASWTLPAFFIHFLMRLRLGLRMLSLPFVRTGFRRFIDRTGGRQRPKPNETHPSEPGLRPSLTGTASTIGGTATAPAGKPSPAIERDCDCIPFAARTKRAQSWTCRSGTTGCGVRDAEAAFCIPFLEVMSCVAHQESKITI